MSHPDHDKQQTGAKKKDVLLGSSVTGPVNDLKGPALAVQGISGGSLLNSAKNSEPKAEKSSTE